MSIADFSALGARLDRAAPRTAVVAAAHDPHTLEAVFAAQRDGLISPILVGRKAEISMLARQLDHALDPGLIVDADGEEDCAQQAVALIRAGRGDMLIKGLLQTTIGGSVKCMQFLDEQRMCRLYEKFILAYYKRHYPQLKATAAQIPWALDDGMDFMLPVMQSDIILTCGNRVLIIDAKYYSHTTQQRYNAHNLHSQNLYQMFTYVKNKEFELRQQKHSVSGMILYAKTDEEIVPNSSYLMSGNQISVQALDLNRDFKEIADELDHIVEKHFSAKS